MMTLTEAAKACGIGQSTLSTWIRLGLVRATLQPIPGKGGYRYDIDLDDVRRVAAEREHYRRPKAGRTPDERKIPPHLLPAFHLFVRLVAMGYDTGHIGQAIAGAAERVRLVDCLAEEVAHWEASDRPRHTMYRTRHGRWIA